MISLKEIIGNIQLVDKIQFLNIKPGGIYS